MGNLGSVLQDPGQLEEAASLLQEAVAGLQALSHRDARTFQKRLDQTRSQMDRLREREQRKAKAQALSFTPWRCHFESPIAHADRSADS